MSARVTVRLAALPALSLWWWWLAAWCLGIPMTAPWSAQSVVLLDARQLEIVAGTARVVDAGLEVHGLGGAAQALQTWRFALAREANDYRYLRYAVDDLPATLEFGVIVRASYAPADVAVWRLPWPRRGKGAFDLATLDEWQSQILEIGFFQGDAGAQLPTPDTLPAFTIRDAALESVSWRGAIAARAAEWLAYAPWTMSEINTVRVDHHVSVRHSPVLAAALGFGGSALIVFLFGAIPPSQRARALLFIVLGAWISLDGWWLLRLKNNDAATRSVFAGKAWNERAALPFDRAVRDRALRMRDALADTPQGAHVLLWSPEKAQTIRLAWFLRPRNVSLLREGTRARDIPDGSVLAVDASDQSWTWYGDFSLLDHVPQALREDRIFSDGLEPGGGSFRIHGDLLRHDGDFIAIRVRKGAAP